MYEVSMGLPKGHGPGVVLPRTGEFYALEFSHSDTEIFDDDLIRAIDMMSFDVADTEIWVKK